MTKPRKLTKPEAASLGGIARKAKLSPARRKAIARNAANARWAREPKGAATSFALEAAYVPAPHTPTGNVQPRVSKEDMETCAKIARKRLGL